MAITAAAAEAEAQQDTHTHTHTYTMKPASRSSRGTSSTTFTQSRVV